MRFGFVALLALGACNGGNPWDVVPPAGPGALRVALGDPDVPLFDGWVTLHGVDVDRCNARPSQTLLLGAWSVVPPTPILLEGGPWCALTVTFDGPLELVGDEVELTLELPDLDLPLDDLVRVDGDAFVLRLGDDGWLTAADLPADGTITEDDAVHDALVRRLTDDAALFRDDEDGVLTDDELSEGSLTGG